MDRSDGSDNDANRSEEGQERERKRVRLACRLCKRRKVKCDGAPSGCENCRNGRVVCEYVDTGVKRGPPKGYSFAKPRQPPNPHPTYPSSTKSYSQAEAGPSSHRTDGVLPEAPRRKQRIEVGKLVDPRVQEHLLEIYWTHIHNIWPLIYKPLFHPSTTPPSLLLSLLAAAAALPLPPSPAPSSLHIDPDSLFRLAEHHVALDAASGKSEVHMVQSYLLFSCRQTNRGNKSASYAWGGRACMMALELGLHRGGVKGLSRAETETRSRVFWCCYITDKVLADETGRPFILRAAATTVPLPSPDEADEFELWPPPAASLPPSVAPVRSRAITAFIESCKLVWFVEQILALDDEGPHGSLLSLEVEQPRRLVLPALPSPEPSPLANLDMSNPEETGAEGLVALSNSLFHPQVMQQRDDDGLRWRVDKLERDMEEWFRRLPAEFKFDPECEVGPPTQYYINVMFYYSTVISLHSRFISLKPDTASRDGPYGTHHRKATQAAEVIMAYLECLDRFKLLGQLSADVIHMLSHATLFFAYNSCLSDPEESSRARKHFQQCCLWMKDISKTWAPASAHRRFFEGLMQGEKRLTTEGQGSRVQGAGKGSPELNGQESVYNSTASNAPYPQPSNAIPRDFFRLPSHYWNDFITNASLVQPDMPTSQLTTSALPLANNITNNGASAVQDPHAYDFLDPALRPNGSGTGLSPFYPGEQWGQQNDQDLGLGLGMGVGAVGGGEMNGDLVGEAATDLMIQFMLDSMQGNPV